MLVELPGGRDVEGLGPGDVGKPTEHELGRGRQRGKRLYEGKTAPVSGGSSGSGQAIAIRLGQEGMSVAVNYVGKP